MAIIFGTLFITRTSDSQRIRIDTGRSTVVKNLANTNADLRSHDKKGF